MLRPTSSANSPIWSRWSSPFTALIVGTSRGRGSRSRRWGPVRGHGVSFAERSRRLLRRLPESVAQLDELAHLAQSAEHFLGKEEVSGSNPEVGSNHQASPRFVFAGLRW